MERKQTTAKTRQWSWSWRDQTKCKWGTFHTWGREGYFTPLWSQTFLISKLFLSFFLPLEGIFSFLFANEINGWFEPCIIWLEQTVFDPSTRPDPQSNTTRYVFHPLKEDNLFFNGLCSVFQILKSN